MTFSACVWPRASLSCLAHPCLILLKYAIKIQSDNLSQDFTQSSVFCLLNSVFCIPSSAIRPRRKCGYCHSCGGRNPPHHSAPQVRRRRILRHPSPGRRPLKNAIFAPELTGDGLCLSTAVSEFEKRLIYQSLEKTKWVKNRAAKLLQVKRTTLVEKIKRYDLQKCA